MATPASHTEWRRDIEGIRGLAVLLVVLYHAEIPGFGGGYVGVDVFFALSGYLITGILVREIENTGSLNIPRFYARRAMRLLPAATALLIGVALSGLLLLSPLAQEELAKTSIAMAFYLSNMFFGRRATNYLAADADTNPLLHTWSLSVEEQFYLLWPALVMVCLLGVHSRRQLGRDHAPVVRGRGRVIFWTGVVVVASFLGMLLLMRRGFTHWAFFSSPSRGWEFGFGGMAALAPLSSRRGGRDEFSGRWGSPNVGRDLGGWAGLAGILVAGVLFGPRTPFPGFAAVLPVLGTVLVLRSGAFDQASVLVRALSWRPLREFGRLSYSWYLWHWPVFVFAESVYGVLSLPVRVGLILLSLGLAEASFRFVERPVRQSERLGRRPAYGLALLGVLTLVASSVSVVWLVATHRVLDSSVQAPYLAVRDDLPDLYARGCHADLADRVPRVCRDGSASATVTIALFGDSHAAQWAPALKEIVEQRQWRLLYLTKSSCPGIATITYLDPVGRLYDECEAWRIAAMDSLRKHHPDLVVMAAWASQGITPQEWFGGTVQTLAELSTSTSAILLLRDSPRPGFDVPSCLSRRAWLAQWWKPIRFAATSCNFPAGDVYQDEVFAMQQRAAQSSAMARAVDLTEWICPENLCRVEQDGVIKFRDHHHLTPSFVRSLEPKLVDLIDAALRGATRVGGR